MKLNVMSFDHKSHETDLDMDAIDSLYVVVVSGDEIVRAFLKDGTECTIDLADFLDDKRIIDFFDGEYGVHKDDFAEWLERKDSYYWFGRMMSDVAM